FDFFLIVLAGFYLCARWQMRGCGYALFLIGIEAAFNHSMIDSHHLWHLGLEGSVACGFFITAMSFEQRGFLTHTLRTQIQTGAATLQNLEEELAKLQEGKVAEQISLQEKGNLLQKELDELQAEHSSILILNEVLRKTAAGQTEENNRLTAVALDQQRTLAQAQVDLAKVEKELARSSNSEAW
ncbi:MAG: hypothetical protein V4487_07935, partial [Chlamydiota bacterium]